jgi:hypothetical protein
LAVISAGHPVFGVGDRDGRLLGGFCCSATSCRERLFNVTERTSLTGAERPADVAVSPN